MAEEKTETALMSFENVEFGTIRSEKIDGEPWFVAKDVAEALGYKDTSDALKKHVDSEDKLSRQIADSGQRRKMYIINESGMYALIFGSQLKSARKFKRWVTSEVLPAIRKSGNYTASPVVSLRDIAVSLQKLTERMSAVEQSVVRGYAIAPDVPDFSDARECVVALVKKAAKENCMSEREIWSDLYRSYEKITGIPLMKSARALGMSVISYVDLIGRMENLKRFAEQVLWFV